MVTAVRGEAFVELPRVRRRDRYRYRNRDRTVIFEVDTDTDSDDSRKSAFVSGISLGTEF